MAKNDGFLSLKAGICHRFMSSQDCLYLPVKPPQHDNLRSLDGCWVTLRQETRAVLRNALHALSSSDWKRHEGARCALTAGDDGDDWDGNKANYHSAEPGHPVVNAAHHHTSSLVWPPLFPAWSWKWYFCQHVMLFQYWRIQKRLKHMCSLQARWLFRFRWSTSLKVQNNSK